MTHIFKFDASVGKFVETRRECENFCFHAPSELATHTSGPPFTEMKMFIFMSGGRRELRHKLPAEFNIFLNFYRVGKQQHLMLKTLESMTEENLETCFHYDFRSKDDGLSVDQS